MLASELYRRAFANLAEVSFLAISYRSVNYALLGNCPQCAVTRQLVHYRSPDRIRRTVFACNPVAAPERSDFVQVGHRARERQDTTTSGEWTETEPVLRVPGDLSALMRGWLALPSADPSAGGVFHTIAFLMPSVASIMIDGRPRPAIILAIEILQHPRLYFPGIGVAHGGGPPASIVYRGEPRRPERIVEEGKLFVEALTARPLRYLATRTAAIEGGVTVPLGRTHARFRYDTDAVIELPPECLSGPASLGRGNING